ncbi:protein kinase, partial [Acidobacteria bacterium AH-259-O06]|nr:protein kinase [Acidobacteria bacterium AH-259-O06]
MDFGLAKRLVPTEGIGSQEQTITASLTKTGATLGTLAYMSPEQVRGEEVDTRSDIFSFGLVLYEMLTGIDPFKKPQPLDTASSILKEDPPPLSRYINEVPPVLQHTVKKMLAKEPERRYQHIDELRIDLEELKQESDSGRLFPGLPPAAEAVPLVPRRKNWERLSWMLATVTLLLGALTLAVVHFSELAEEGRAVRFSVSLPEKISFTSLDLPAISPDGRHIAFTGATAEGKRLLWVRSLDSLTARSLTDTQGATLPFWSPDSRFIGFFAGAKLKKIEHSGGPAQILCDAPRGRGGTWNGDGVILFTPTSRDPLYSVSEAGGVATPMTTLEKSRGELSHRWPYFLPDGRHFLYAAEGPQERQGDVYLGSFDSKDVKQVLSDYSNTTYVPPGYLLFLREGTLMAQAFDAKNLQIMGQAFPVAEQVGYSAIFGVGHFSASEDKVLVYHQGVGVRQTQLVWVDREGHEEPLAAEPGRYFGPRVSPDGARLAFSIDDPGNTDMWIYDLRRETFTRLTFDPAMDDRPLWTPDGLRVVFRSTRDGGASNLFWKAADGTGQVERLTTSPNYQDPDAWSRDGKGLVFHEANSSGVVAGGFDSPETSGDISVLSMEGEPISEPLLQTQFSEGGAAISPDGRWMAYHSDETGRQEIYVRPFPNVEEGKWQISGDGGISPLWGPKGRELFYRNSGAMMVVRIETEPTFVPGSPEVIFTGAYISHPSRYYDISPDGQRFVMIKEAEQAEESSARTQLIVVENWFEEL